MDMRFGIWKVNGLYRAGSPKMGASELANSNSDLVAVQEASWVEGNSQPADTFLYGSGKVNNHLGFFIHKGIIPAVKRVKFISDSDTMSYITFRCCWCETIVLNVHAPTEDKSGDTKDSFNDEIEHGFDKPLKF